MASKSPQLEEKMAEYKGSCLITLATRGLLGGAYGEQWLAKMMKSYRPELHDQLMTLQRIARQISI